VARLNYIIKTKTMFFSD